MAKFDFSCSKSNVLVIHWHYYPLPVDHYADFGNAQYIFINEDTGYAYVVGANRGVTLAYQFINHISFYKY